MLRAVSVYASMRSLSRSMPSRSTCSLIALAGIHNRNVDPRTTRHNGDGMLAGNRHIKVLVGGETSGLHTSLSRLNVLIALD